MKQDIDVLGRELARSATEEAENGFPGESLAADLSSEPMFPVAMYVHDRNIHDNKNYFQ